MVCGCHNKDEDNTLIQAVSQEVKQKFDADCSSPCMVKAKDCRTFNFTPLYVFITLFLINEVYR
jgi:hypothetical protein